ncbi:UDP-N-acetylmuramoyl-L-alanyl-D-glutamate--2,6-diaminopimelate ligase [Gaoshiqia sediminis]|uniref:UDP-N-acetylmuramoyl-L-alanyl-D-glutamate--2,6-diaminopimelate ligase n=1 Tax=Gaoshiqia sediminis TaxID=2986998 RepID=A0AA41Y327_9BACT|nr:UDP-N-acetylmuramoyl-L-alanyl-D-glutamate--2,6-diaminopimelate ligase [Gaoshiqia sediminis]MCW0482519.1 UDP-N-acetylmuramoyl-L-alanyl-D-glutamate--2,6-diaminopimelate ligase [Gaoshiqia sediminis]
MKTLNEILSGLNYELVSGDLSVPVGQIHFDSRKVARGDVFVAVSGTHVDGHAYIPKALENGASVIVAEKSDVEVGASTLVRMDHTAKAMGLLAANYYGNPSANLKVVGVTGTNGKTTIATLLYRLFKKVGYKAGLISTIKYYVGDEEFPATHTTPDALQIQSLMADMVDAGCQYCFMEVSSHAIDQDRIAGIEFDGGIFTNLTHDHLDYHKTFAEYLKAKKKFFDNLPATAFALTNGDEKNGRVMLQNTKAVQKTYALKSLADFKCKVLEKHLDGMLLDVDGTEVWTHFSGIFNAYNLLSVYATALLLGEKADDVLPAMSELRPVAGRFEILRSPDGKYAIVDYAHTPDALKNVLSGISEIRTGNEQVITVVGAGGDRDKTKRPVMAKEAVLQSDRVILTSDNPRTEVPEQIIADMEVGVEAHQRKKVLSIVNRKEAIRTACMLAQPGDIILVAGKGHEDYQEINGVKYHFDDKEVISEIFNAI